MADPKDKDKEKKPASTMEYKGQKAVILMMGRKQTIPGWRGELFTAVVQYGPSKEQAQYDVIPDSTNPGELDDLPEVKTFDNYGAAVNHFMKLEQNKEKWKK